jgi:hypothetical protein
MGNHIVIDDSNYLEHAQDWRLGEHVFKRGNEDRDFDEHPVGCFAAAPKFDMDIIPASDWLDAWEQQKGNKATLSDIRARGAFGERIPSLDQDGYGYCWGHSATSAAILARARENQPYVRLSAFSVCCPIKHFRDEGGFGGQAVQYIADNGIASVEAWPEKSVDKSLVSDPTKAKLVSDSRLLHHVTEWLDLGRRDGKCDMRQVVTCLLLGLPLVVDFNWWSHSVCGIRIANLYPKDETADIVIWNSWTDSWSEHGEGTLKGNHAIPDSAQVVRVGTASQT